MSRYSIGPAALGSATPAFPATSSIFHTCVSSSPPRVQHRHPFVSSTTSPSAPPVEPPGVSRATSSASMLSSAKSFTAHATFRSCRFASTWRMTVVLPLPSHPVTSVVGSRRRSGGANAVLSS
jgi:hypothetical protein